MTKSDQRIHDLLVRISKSSRCKTHGRATRQAFQSKSARLPKVYTEIIRAFSYVKVGKQTLLGYLHPDDPRSDRQKAKVDADSLEMQLFGSNELYNEADELDIEVFPIMVLGPREYIVLWTKKTRNGDCPVIHWKPATKRMNIVDRSESLPKNVINKSFIDWMNDLLDREGGPERKDGVVKLPKMRTVDYTVPANATIEQLCEMFRKHPNVKVGKPATDAEIQACESTLKVILPDAVRTYLRMVGHVEIAHNEVCGLGAGTKKYDHLSLLKNTLMWRDEGFPALRQDLVVVHDNGAGDAMCVLTNGKRRADAPVIFWSHEHPDAEEQSLERWAPSFTAYLRQMLQQTPDI